MQATLPDIFSWHAGAFISAVRRTLPIPELPGGAFLKSTWTPFVVFTGRHPPPSSVPSSPPPLPDGTAGSRQSSMSDRTYRQTVV